MTPVMIGPNVQSSLSAHTSLMRTTDQGCGHHANGLRSPLGIYNISISRICDKLTRLCRRLEICFQKSHSLTEHEYNDVKQEVIDYIELSLYAAAEHVDDIESITSGFFKNNVLRDKNSAFKTLQKEVKKNKRLISTAANKIKHEQSRIRIFSTEFSLGSDKGFLHGYFFEGVVNGEVGPHRLIHDKQNVFSITTLVWEIIVFLVKSSEALSLFLQEVGHQIAGPMKIESTQFMSAVVAAARLPLYTFGEEHPFNRTPLSLIFSEDQRGLIESNLYGTMQNDWQVKTDPVWGAAGGAYEGDGVTTTFKLFWPETVAFIKWRPTQ